MIFLSDILRKNMFKTLLILSVSAILFFSAIPVLSVNASESIQVKSISLLDIARANGKKPILELTAIMNGNIVDHAKGLPGDSKGSGIIIINQDDQWAYTIGVHTYNNCLNSDCGEYKIHGHKSKIEESAFCESKGYHFHSLPNQTSDFAKGRMHYNAGKDKTIVTLLGIPASEKLLPSYKTLCNNNHADKVGSAYLYETQYFPHEGPKGTICVKLSQETPISSFSSNGFSSEKTPEICNTK